MKTQFLFFLLILLTGYVNDCQSQSQLQKKLLPLKFFENDTMAYMEKNYDGTGVLYGLCGKTLGDVLKDAEIPFKSYVIAETLGDDYPAIVFALFFTVPADEVRALYKSGKPVYGVFCNFVDNMFRNGKGERKELYDALSPLVTNRINNFDKSSIKVLKDIQIEFARFYDQRGWFTIYKIK